MSITSSTSFLFFFIVAEVVLLATVVPSGMRADITACDGAPTGTWDSDFTSGGGSNINPWGFAATTCYGSRVTGLPKLKSFTFWVRQDAGSTATAMGVVINPDTNQAVTSVDISTLLPTTNAYLAVTADFESLVTLDSTKTYMLTFCATSGNAQYSMDSISSGDSFRYCNNYVSCTTDGTVWDMIGSDATLRSNIAGDCTFSSSASQLAAPQWAGALARVFALLTALWH